MTVCVATIAQGAVFGACDRMITSGDIEFEPDGARKLLWFTPSMVVLWAGDAAFQAEVLQQVHRVIGRRVAERPDDWWNVADVVAEYVTAWRAAKTKRAENDVLGPIGLTIERLQSGDHGFSDEVVVQILHALSDYRMPTERGGSPVTETIIAGVDRSGGNGEVIAHLYRLWDDQFSCEDAIGFAAIGSGAWHANSQLMLAKYDSTKTFAEALWRTYVAKRRAEVAPGVGDKGTNMFSMGPGLGFHADIQQAWIEELASRYARLANSEKKASDTALVGVGKWLASLSSLPKTQDVGGGIAVGVARASAAALTVTPPTEPPNPPAPQPPLASTDGP